MNIESKVIARINRLNWVKFQYPYPNNSVGNLGLGDGFTLRSTPNGYSLYLNESLLEFLKETDAITNALHSRQKELEALALEAL